jgi:hypothetical protein
MPEIMCMMERMSANFSKGDDAIFNEHLTYFKKHKDTNQKDCFLGFTRCGA